jgi:potassium-transporting ATPase ATP-binding subunit
MNKQAAIKEMKELTANTQANEEAAITQANKEAARTRKKSLTLLDPVLLKPAVWGAIVKLNPAVQWRNPVMFVVYIGSIITTLLWLQAPNEPSAVFTLGVSVWLWFTVLFANFAEALAEGRSKAQAASLRGLRQSIWARKLDAPHHGAKWLPEKSEALRRGDLVLVEAHEMIPLDGEVIEGVASVDESAITGESAPVVRESGGDFSSVTGGTRVLSDWLVVRITVNPGESFLDRMIGMVEAAKRQKTPNEIALTILLIALTIVFLVVTVTLLPFSVFSVQAAKAGTVVSLTALVSLLVCLIPTTIGGLLSAVGVAGMSRMMQANVIATSGRAVEAAGDVDVLLLDKTGTITHGNRQASLFVPAPGTNNAHLARLAVLASLADDTPEGRSIVDLARRQRVDDRPVEGSLFLPFTAQTRMSGADVPQAGGQLLVVRKGAVDAVRNHVQALGGTMPAEVVRASDDIARRGSTPLAVAEGAKVLGVIELKDIVKTGIKERFAELRRMGIKTVMITGDNKITAAAIAAEAGVDDFLAEATPEDKLKLIRQYHEQRHPGGKGSGQHGGPGFESHQAARSGGDRQGAADDARLADDILHRQ